MGITNKYPNLPGHLVEFKDGGLQLTSLPDDSSGFKKSLLILGTALDGPINEPVKIDAKTVTQLFGSEVNDKNYPNGATLTKYAKQAFAHGFSDVRCMRVTGTEASKSFSINSEVESIDKEYTTKATIIAAHPSVEIELNAKPIATDADAGRLVLCTSIDTDGNPSGGAVASNIEYSPSVGTFKVPADTFKKNGIIYAVYKQQNIAQNAATTVVVNGETIDTKDAPLDASLFDADAPGGIEFNLPYDYSNDTRLYSQPYSMIGDEIQYKTADCYPSIVSLVEAAGCSEEEALEKAKDLKVVIIANYDGGSVVLGKNDFQVFESTGVVRITKTGVETTTKQQVPNPAYDADDLTSNEPEFNEVDVPTTVPFESFNVMYFTYVNEHVHERIDLGEKTDAKDKPKDDYITLLDGGKAKNIEVIQNRLPISTDKYTVDNSGANTVITLPAGVLPYSAEISVSYTIKETTTAPRSVTFKSIYGGEVYNQARIKMEKLREEPAEDGTLGAEYIKITFCKPESKYYSKTEVPFYYKSTDVPTVGQLRDFLKNYELNNVFAIETDEDDLTLEGMYDAICKNMMGVGNETEDQEAVQALADASTVVDFTLEGGTSGINPSDEELFVALSGKRDNEGYLLQRGAYQILENYHCDYIYPAGARADKKVYVNGRYQSFQYELALVCAVLTYRTKMTHGFIDVSSNSNTSLVGVQKHVDKLLAMPNLFYMEDNKGDQILDSENQPMDIGWYTSVVVGPDPVMLSDTLGTYYGSSAIAYAALVASLKPQSSPMNKALPKVKGMKYKFSNKQMDALIGNRMVCFRLKNEGTTTATSIPYCVDAMTAGGPKCDYARMTTVSIVTDVVDQIREVADPFIGEPNTIEQRNALSALIAKRLSRIYEQGEVTYYSFEINATIQQVLLGECTISLTLVCPMELRKITTVVSLRAAA